MLFLSVIVHVWGVRRSVFKQSLSQSVRIAHPLPWIMHKDELFIIILQGLLCTSTSWLVYCPFSSHQLNLKKDLQLHLPTNHNPTEVSTLLFHYQHTAIHPHLPPTEEFHQDSLSIRNHIYVLLLHSHLTSHPPFPLTTAIHLGTLLHLGLRPCYPSTLNLSWNRNQNLVQCPPFQLIHQDRRSQFQSDPNKEVVRWRIHSQKRSPNLKKTQLLCLRYPIAPHTVEQNRHLLQSLNMMTRMNPTRLNHIACPLYGPTRQCRHRIYVHPGVRQCQKSLQLRHPHHLWQLLRRSPWLLIQMRLHQLPILPKRQNLQPPKFQLWEVAINQS